jgi:hypothetical protein
MTRPKNVEEVAWNQLIDEGIAGVKSKLYGSYTEAANKLKVPCLIITHRTCGYPPKPSTVLEMADTFQSQRVIGINNSSVAYVSYDSIGEQWHRHFMNWHNKLECIILESIEAAQVKESTAETIQKWFDNVNLLIETQSIKPEEIFNLDETGFSIGSIKATRVVVINKTQWSQYSAQPGCQEWLSVIECISMAGNTLPPLVIFKGKTLSKAWLPANTPKDWFFSCNTQGWTGNEQCKKWLAEDFEPYT